MEATVSGGGWGEARDNLGCLSIALVLLPKRAGVLCLRHVPKSH